MNLSAKEINRHDTWLYQVTHKCIHTCGSWNEIIIYVGDCEKKLYKSLINCF